MHNQFFECFSMHSSIFLMIIFILFYSLTFCLSKNGYNLNKFSSKEVNVFFQKETFLKIIFNHIHNII